MNDVDEIQRYLEYRDKRIGKNIRKARELHHPSLTQAELGEMVGLNANRIQQYENAARKPKMELLLQIADALDVEYNALVEPVVDSPIGVMFFLFEMEDLYDVNLDQNNGQVSITVTDDKLNNYLQRWFRRKNKFIHQRDTSESREDREIAVLNYNLWKLNFPECHDDETDGDEEKEIIMEKIDELQRELNRLQSML